MDEPLHPSTLSEILDHTAQIYRSRFLVFFGIAVLPTAALLVVAGGAFLFALRLGSAGNGPTPLMVAGLLGAVLVAMLAMPILLAITALAMAAMSHASSRAFLGQTTTIRASYKAVWRRGWRYIGLFAFEVAVIWAVPFGAWFSLLVLFGGLAALAQSAGLGADGALLLLTGFLIVLGLISYGFWMALRLSLAFPACVVEQIGAWDGVRRSSLLTHGTKGRIFLLYLLGLALNWILSMAITLPLVVVLALIPGSSSPQHVQTMGMVFLFAVYGAAFAVQALTRPVYGIALMLFYYDQRIRQEGFDIEWMMLKAGLVAPQPQLGIEGSHSAARAIAEKAAQTPAEQGHDSAEQRQEAAFPAGAGAAGPSND